MRELHNHYVRGLTSHGCNYYNVVMAPKTRTTTAIRFPDEVLERLKKAAEERDVSVNFLVVKSVEESLDRLVPAEEWRLTRVS